MSIQDIYTFVYKNHHSKRILQDGYQYRFEGKQGVQWNDLVPIRFVSQIEVQTIIPYKTYLIKWEEN